MNEGIQYYSKDNSTVSIVSEDSDDNKRKRFEVLSQVLAVLVKNILVLPIGMSLGFITILIPRISGNDPNEGFSLTEEQVSWIGSSISISTCIGNFASGFISHFFGRVRVFIAISVPTFLGWVIYYFTSDIWHLFVATSLNGLSGGLIGAAIHSYVTEITQPRLRGMLSATNSFTVVFGVFLEIFVGTFLPWRTAAILSSIVPVTAFCALWFLPESPYWLLSQKKEELARKSLAWYRGWNTISSTEIEFQNMKKSYQNNENKLKDFKKSSFYSLYSNFTGGLTLQTYSAIIFASLDVPINKYYATLLMGSCELIGCLLSIALVRYLGRRKIGFISLTAVVLCNVFIGIYAFLNEIRDLRLKSDFENVPLDISNHQWIPLFLLLFLSFSGHCGLKSLPWIMMGEVFSFETRSIGCGFCTTVFSITGFLSNKIFLTMVHGLTFSGVYWFHTCVGCVGLIVIYLFLPETEGKSLEEINDHFACQSKLDKNVRRK